MAYSQAWPRLQTSLVVFILLYNFQGSCVTLVTLALSRNLVAFVVRPRNMYQSMRTPNSLCRRHQKGLELLLTQITREQAQGTEDCKLK